MVALYAVCMKYSNVLSLRTFFLNSFYFPFYLQILHTLGNMWWSAVGAVFCCKRFIFVIELAFVIFWQFRDIHRRIIWQTLETVPVQCPCPILGREFFNRLGYNKWGLPHVVECPVVFRRKARITAIYKLSHPNCWRILASRGFRDFCSFWSLKKGKKLTAVRHRS